MMKNTVTALLIHIAGTYYPDVGQSCIICGETLEEGKGWNPTKEAEPWEVGGLILIDGESMMDLNIVEENEEDYHEAIRCQELWT